MYVLIALNACLDFVLMHSLTQKPLLYVFQCCINSGEEDWWVLGKFSVTDICKALGSLAHCWFLSTALNFYVILRMLHVRLGHVVRPAFTNSSLCPTYNGVHYWWQIPVHNLYLWFGNQSKQIQYHILDSRSWLTFLSHWCFFHSLWILYKLCRITLNITNSRAGKAVTP